MKSGWSVRELKRQRDSMLFERAGLSKDKDAVMRMAKEGTLTETPATLLRDPYILEFLGLEERTTYTESLHFRTLIERWRNSGEHLGTP